MKKLLLSLLCLAGLSASAQTSYELITSADGLTDGAEYILVGETKTTPVKYYAMINTTGSGDGAVTSTAYRNTVEVTPDGGVITVEESSNISVITLEAGSTANKYAIKGTVGYLTFTGTNTGNLKESAELATDGTADFTLTFESNGSASFANVGKNGRALKFNYNNGSRPRFGNYKDSDTNSSFAFLYKKVEGTAPVVARPTFSVAGGDIAKGTEVEISCVTEGATIYYTLDDTEPAETSTEYTAPIAINESCTLKAIAVKGTDKSSVASVAYTVVEPITLAQANQLAKDNTFIMGSDLTVVYSNGANVYVYDPVDKAYSLIYKYNLNLKEGDVIAKGWAGKMDVYNGLPELVPASDITVSGTADVPEFATVEADQITNALVNQPVIVNGVTFAAATPSANSEFDGTVGDATLKFYNKFKLASVGAGDYDVTAIVSINDKGSTTLGTTVNLFPISIVKATDGIADIEAEAAGEAVYYNLQGVRVENPVNGMFIEVRGNKAVKVVK